MPTASKLIGAILFGAMGLAIAWLIVPTLEGADSRKPWIPIFGAVGLWAGWSIMGRGTRQGYGPAVGIGLTAAAALAFVGLFVMSFWRMWARAMDGGFGADPVGAVVSIFTNIADYAVQLVTPQIGLILVVGGLLGGIVSEFVGRRFR